MRYIKDGKVAVVYSPFYGAGWSTWNREHSEILMMHPLIAEAVHEWQSHLLSEHAYKNKLHFALDILGLGQEDLFIEDITTLAIFWLNPGDKFMIEEYDGKESVILFDQIHWTTA